MARTKCKATKRNGDPCGSFAVSAAGWCVSHDPDRAEVNREASRRGGESRSAARRAARAWALTGAQIRQDDLPAILRATMLDVRTGRLEPSVATAIATLARVSVSLTTEIELEQRIAALEAAVQQETHPQPIRRIA